MLKSSSRDLIPRTIYYLLQNTSILFTLPKHDCDVISVGRACTGALDHTLRYISIYVSPAGGHIELTPKLR